MMMLGSTEMSVTEIGMEVKSIEEMVILLLQRDLGGVRVPLLLSGLRPSNLLQGRNDLLQ